MPLEDLTTLSTTLNQIPTISPSQLGVWLNCRMEWKYSYTDNLRKKYSTTAKMDRGTYIHRLLHYYYNLMKAGFPVGSPVLIQSMERKFQEDLQELDTENVNLLSSSLPVVREYVNSFSKTVDGGITVLAVEKEYHVLMVTPKGFPFFLHGFIDLVYRNSMRKIKVLDHKSGEKTGTWADDKIEFDLQLFMYELAIYHLFGEQPSEVGINFINVSKNPAIRFERFTNNHSYKKLMAFEEELLTIVDEMFDGPIYRRYSKDCARGCKFYKLCTRDQEGLPTAPIISTEFERTNRTANLGTSKFRFRTEPEETGVTQPVEISTTRNHENSEVRSNTSIWEGVDLFS